MAKFSGFACYEDAIANYPSSALEEQPEGATMLYSSGSTGQPKGIKRRLPQRDISDFPKRGLAPILKSLALGRKYALPKHRTKLPFWPHVVFGPDPTNGRHRSDDAKI